MCNKKFNITIDGKTYAFPRELSDNDVAYLLELVALQEKNLKETAVETEKWKSNAFDVLHGYKEVTAENQTLKKVASSYRRAAIFMLLVLAGISLVMRFAS